MKTKSSKVFLESAGRDQTVRGNEPTRWMYRVVRLVNTMEPRIDTVIGEAEVSQMISDGVDVTITPRSESR